MSAPLAVVDTNVVVSGLLTSHTDAPTARILDGMLQARFPFLLSGELLEESRAVLLRPKIRGRHRLAEKEIDLILTDLVANARFRQIERVPKGRARGDEHLWMLVALEPGCILVTGDRPLSRDSRDETRVLSPREFVALLEA